MAEPIAVIINAHAGGEYDPSWAQSLTSRFRQAGLAASVTLAANGEQMRNAARAAVGAGATTVVAGGGDGTINAVASIVAGSQCTLGILALGTLNHFARDLGIPLDINAAIAVIAVGHTVAVDTGEVNGRLFLNNSSLGIYPDIVRNRERQQRLLGRSKWRAFASAAVTALRRYPFMTVRLAVDGQQHARRTPFVFIGNNAYVMSGFNFGERPSLTDGMLSLYVAQRTSRLGLIRLALCAVLGHLRKAGDFDVLPAFELLIETPRRRLPVATDGEVTWLATPLHYRIRPLALRVIVPEPDAS